MPSASDPRPNRTVPNPPASIDRRPTVDRPTADPPSAGHRPADTDTARQENPRWPSDRPPRSKSSEPDGTATGVRELPLVALRETVIFPEMIVPLQVGREKSVKALNAAVAEGATHRARHPAPGRAGGHQRSVRAVQVGTLAKIAQVVQLQDGTVRAIVQGQRACACSASSRPTRTSRAPRRGAARRDARRPRGPGADAHGPGPDRAVRPSRRAGPAGGGRRRAQHHRAGPAGRHGRLQPGHDHRAAPGAARDDRRHRAPQARLELPRATRSRSSS